MQNAGGPTLQAQVPHARKASPSNTPVWPGGPHSIQLQVGDFVYLIPEDPSSPLYLARVINAYEDTMAEGSDRLCIEVGAVCVHAAGGLRACRPRTVRSRAAAWPTQNTSAPCLAPSQPRAGPVV